MQRDFRRGNGWVGGDHNLIPQGVAALAELEQLVGQLDAGQLPLDQLLTHYQRGAMLLSFCRARLAAVEQQIQQLDNNELKPWEGA